MINSCEIASSLTNKIVIFDRLPQGKGKDFWHLGIWWRANVLKFELNNHYENHVLIHMLFEKEVRRV